MRIPPNGRVGLLALLLLAGGCGEALENVPPRPAAIDDPAVADADFPSLASVPARPRLSYTLEQRREIAEGLVADRANARYTGDELRRAQGRPVLPDTAPPLPPPPVAAPATASDPGTDLALAYVEEALARDSDDGSLNDFLDRLQQPPPAVADVLTEAEDDATAIDAIAEPAVGPDAPAAAAGEERTAVTGDAGSEQAARADALGPADEPSLAAAPSPAPAADAPASVEPGPRAIVTERADTSTPERATPGTAPRETVAPAAGPSAAPTAGPAVANAELPLAILFEPNGAEIAAAEHDRLHQLAPRLADTAATIVVSGGGPRPGLAMERARRVAATLVGAGLRPTRIAIEMGGESDVVVVYEAGA